MSKHESEFTARILMINKYANVNDDGYAGSRSTYLASEFAKRGFDVKLLYETRENPAQPTKTNQKIARLANNGRLQLCEILRSKLDPSSFARIVSWIKFEFRVLSSFKVAGRKPDIIIASSPSPITILTGIFLKSFTKAKLVYEIRDVWPDTITDYSNHKRFNPFVISLSLINRAGISMADLVVGTMPNLASWVHKYRSDVKIGCIPIGFVAPETNDINKFEPELDAFLDENFFIVSYAGSIGRSNELGTILQVAERFQMKENRFRLLIVGEGRNKLALQQKYSHLSNTFFYPRIARAAVQKLLKRSDVLYAGFDDVSVFRYGQSLNKLVEYMANEKPIVISYSGFPSMINEAKCGFIVPANDVLSLEEVFERIMRMSKVERENLGRRGALWIKRNRSYEKLAEEYIQLLKSIY